VAARTGGHEDSINGAAFTRPRVGAVQGTGDDTEPSRHIFGANLKMKAQRPAGEMCQCIPVGLGLSAACTGERVVK
jgi:hypothetical protein